MAVSSSPVKLNVKKNFPEGLRSHRMMTMAHSLITQQPNCVFSFLCSKTWLYYKVNVQTRCMVFGSFHHDKLLLIAIITMHRNLINYLRYTTMLWWVHWL